jgi:hypothetical protein
MSLPKFFVNASYKQKLRDAGSHENNKIVFIGKCYLTKRLPGINYNSEKALSNPSSS